MPQTIFITGASGYIGTILTSHCISSGFAVRALSRSDASDEKLKSLGATPVRGDLQTLDVLTREASNADMVISLADSLTGNYGKITMEERFRINNAAITALGQGVEGTGKPLVVTSGTLHAAPDPNGGETDESSPKATGTLFGEGIEAVSLDLREKGVKISIVRLAPWVYGRGGSGVRLFIQGALQTGQITCVSPGTSCTTTVHVDDAARLFLLVAQNGRAGEVYNATSETNITFKQLSEAMAKVVGVPVQYQSYEEVEAKTGSFFASFLSSANRASSAKARNELGWKVQADKGILEEITDGSYVEVVEELRTLSG